MKEIIKKMFLFFKELLKSLLSIYRLSRNYYRFDYQKESVRDEIYILGNGPSLKEVLNNNISNFRGKDLMVVNNMVGTKEFLLLRPRYYALADPAYFSNINTLHNDTQKRVLEVIVGLAEKVDWDMILFLPAEARNKDFFLENFRKNSYIHVNFINSFVFNGFKSWQYCFLDKKIVSFCWQTVLIMCVNLAIFMNYKTVYLFGADHDWIKDIYVNDNNEIEQYDFHFYDKGQLKERKNITKIVKQSENQEYRIHDLLFDVGRALKEYHIIADYVKDKPIKIYNATKGSYIDAFDRKSPFD